MIQAETFNQFLFILFGLVLASLFVGTLRVGVASNRRITRRYWLLSLGTRAGAFFSWAAIPVLGPVCIFIANGLFIFSAGCLALLFRSWRVPIDRRRLLLVAVFSLAVGAGMAAMREYGASFGMRMIFVGSASLAVSAWELYELRKKLKVEAEHSLKLIAAIVVLQMAMSAAAVISSLLHNDTNISYVTDNGTISMYVIWSTLAVHLLIYLFIGGYLYRLAILGELKAVQERNDVSALLEERERLLASLIMSNRVAATGALSATIAHEMSQPLTAAMLKLGLLKHAIREVPDNSPDSHSLLQEALDNIDRSKSVLDHLRALFRQGPAKVKRCRLHELVTQSISLMHVRLEAARIKLEYVPALSASAEIVDKEIQQVLINLINNAIESLAFADHGDKRIRIEVIELSEAVRITVSDNGPGIQPELADSLFELARTSKSSGMGIGLWISRFIIEDHHRGKICVDTSHTPGACFVIEFPERAAG